MTAEVVATETPANRATSRIVFTSELPRVQEQLFRCDVETDNLHSIWIEYNQHKLNRYEFDIERANGRITLAGFHARRAQ
jgi:hypothetical protein